MSSSFCDCKYDCENIESSSSSSSCEKECRSFQFGEDVSKKSRITLNLDTDNVARIYKERCPGSFWAVSSDIPNSEYYNLNADVATDCEGNNFVLGYYVGTVTIGNNDFVLNSIVPNFYNFYVAKYDPTFNVVAAAQFACESADAYYITLDCKGNVYLVGYFDHLLYFTGSNSTNIIQIPGNSNTYYGSGFLIKWNNNLEYINATSINGSVDVYAQSSAILKKDKIVIDGTFDSTVSFSPSVQFTTNGSSIGAYVALYNTESLNFENAAQIQSDSNVVPRLVVSYCPEKIIYESGVFIGTITFLSASPAFSCNNSYTLVNSGAQFNCYIAKYNQNLRVCKAISFGGTEVNILDINGVCCDGDGNIYIAGNFSGTMQFNSNNVFYSSRNSIFIAKYSKNLKFCKVNIAQGSSGASVGEMKYLDGNMYITGYFDGTMTFDSKHVFSGFFETGFFVKYSCCDLKLQFATVFMSGSNMVPMSLSMDSSGYAYIVGGFIGATATFGCITATGYSFSFVGFIAKAIASKPKLRARLCCNGIQGKRIRNPFSENFELNKVKVKKEHKLVPAHDYFSTETDPFLLKGSNNACTCFSCNKSTNCRRECAQYVGTAVGTNCILTCKK